MKKNKTVLVTGSSKGIGLSIAKTLSSLDLDVIITGRNHKSLESAIKNEKNMFFYKADLTIEKELINLVKNIEEKHGNIDILINNAGDYIYSSIEKTKQIDIDYLLKLNTIAPYKLIIETVGQMKEKMWGRIVNIGSISGSVGEANASLYSMTKASLIGLTKALALELAEYNITVNTINPGWVDTDLANNTDLKNDFSKEEILEMIPQRRFVHPLEVANLCKYLISEEARGLTGQSINLCAGLSLG